jgi:hypothetical protein
MGKYCGSTYNEVARIGKFVRERSQSDEKVLEMNSSDNDTTL